MLKGIDPLLSPDLLRVLASMGHGDTIAIVDANFPASSLAKSPDRVIYLPGVTVPAAAAAVLSLLPLDEATDASPAARCMAVVGNEREELPIMAEFRAVIAKHEGADRGAAMVRTERFRFYDHARSAFAIVATGETRLYGNLLLTKGVVKADAGAVEGGVEGPESGGQRAGSA